MTAASARGLGWDFKGRKTVHRVRYYGSGHTEILGEVGSCMYHFGPCVRVVQEIARPCLHALAHDIPAIDTHTAQSPLHNFMIPRPIKSHDFI